MLDLDFAKLLMRDQVILKGEDHFYEENKEDFYGEQVNSGCQYVHTTNGISTPGCIVGGGLVAAGIPLATFEEQGVNRDTAAPEAIKALVKSGHIGDATLEAVDYLSMVQASQDDGVTWGTAVSDGDDVYYRTDDAYSGVSFTVKQAMNRSKM
jgi:hypothetical protein